MSHRTNDPMLQVPPRQLRDGLLLIALGLVVALWIGYGAVGSGIGVLIALWGLVLVGNALWVRSRRRTE